MDVDDVLIYIFNYIHSTGDFITLRHCCLVNKQWSRVIKSRAFAYIDDGLGFYHALEKNSDFRKRFNDGFIDLVCKCGFHQDLTARINAFRVKKINLEKLTRFFILMLPQPKRNHRTIAKESIRTIYTKLVTYLKTLHLTNGTQYSHIVKSLDKACRMLLPQNPHLAELYDSYEYHGENSSDKLASLFGKLLWIFISKNIAATNIHRVLV